MDGTDAHTIAVFLRMFDGRYPWESFDERRHIEASPDPADQQALSEIQALRKAAWGWMESHAPVPWTSANAAEDLSHYLTENFPWCVGDVQKRILNWA